MEPMKMKIDHEIHIDDTNGTATGCRLTNSEGIPIEGIERIEFFADATMGKTSLRIKVCPVAVATRIIARSADVEVDMEEVQKIVTEMLGARTAAESAPIGH